jgi:hypothetical protein
MNIEEEAVEMHKEYNKNSPDDKTLAALLTHSNALAALSIAVSLKRIADKLDEAWNKILEENLKND